MVEEDAEFKDVWADAFSLYQQNTQRDPVSDPNLTTLMATEDLLKEIETHQQNFLAFRERKARMWTLLRSTMRGVEVLGCLTENALTLTPFSYTSPVLGAVLYLVTAAKGVSEAYDSILNLLAQLQDFTDRLHQYTRATVEPKLRRKVVDILTTLLEIFARSEHLIKKARFKQYISVTFLGGNEKVAQGVERLKDLVEAEARLVGSLTYSTALTTSDTIDRSERILQKADKATERLESKLEGIAISVYDSRRDSTENEERAVLNQTLDDSILAKTCEEHDDITERRLGGTADWIKAEPLFQEWVQEQAPILWVLGGPGAGKSFLSSRIISYLQEVHLADIRRKSVVSVAYFYIKENDQQLCSVNAGLKVIALQLAAKDPIFRRFAADICKTKVHLGTAKRTWLSLFMGFFGSHQRHNSTAFILIDGLDEAPKKEQEIFIQLLYSLEQARFHEYLDCPRIQFAVVGRPELLESINSTWKSHPTFIEVSASKNSDDIKNYILKSIDRVKALKLRHIPVADRKELRLTVIKKLNEGANGMFLWVNLMLDQIRNISRPSDIFRALNAAPRDLGKMIHHVFERIATDSSTNKADLNEILLWVTCAEERLSLGEMSAILKLRPPIGEGMPDLEERLREQFASIFTLSRKDKLSTERLQLPLRDERRESLLHEDDGDIEDAAKHGSPSQDEDDEGRLVGQAYESPCDDTYLEFSHSSIRDFLLQEGKLETRKWPADSGVGINLNKAQFHITATLLTLLCDVSHETTLWGNILSRHAANHCLFHLQRLDRSILDIPAKKAIIRPLFTLFHEQAIISRWFEYTTLAYRLWVQGILIPKSTFDCVRNWFADEGMRDYGFTSKEISRIGVAAQSGAELVRPIALYCTRMWLAPDADDRDPEFYVWSLDTLRSLDDHRNRYFMASAFSLLGPNLGKFTIAHLRSLAEFGGYPKSSIWYRRFGQIIRDAGYINAALKQFDNSMKLCDTDSVTMLEIAYCYEDKKDFFSAIYWATKAEATTFREQCTKRWLCLFNISRWWLPLGHRENAMSSSRRAMSLDPNDQERVLWHLSLLKEDSRYSEIMDVVEIFYHSPGSDKEAILSRILTDASAHPVFVRAAKSMRKTDLLLRALEDNLVRAGRTNHAEEISERSFFVADLRCKHVSDPQQAIAIWKDLLARLEPRGSDDSNSQIIQKILNNLSQLYYDEALATEAKGQDASSWITELRNTSELGNTSKPSAHKGRENLLLLGLWSRKHGGTAAPRAYFKMCMLIAIMTYKATEDAEMFFRTFACVLHAAEDSDNAHAAVAASLAPLEELRAERQSRREAWSQIAAQKDASAASILNRVNLMNEYMEHLDAGLGTEQSRDFTDLRKSDIDTPLEDFDALDLEAQEIPFRMKPKNYERNCDGGCPRRVEEWQKMFICEICLDVCFCEECVELVKNDQLDFRICNPNHAFWQIYPFDTRLLDVAAEKVNGKVVPRVTWLEKIRKEWNV